MKAYYSLTEAAQILGYVDGRVLRTYIHRGSLRAKKIGSDWVIDYITLEKQRAKLAAKKEKHDQLANK